MKSFLFKFYFWVVLLLSAYNFVVRVLNLVGFYGLGWNEKSWFGYADMLGVQVVALIGLYAYLYQKEIGKKGFWKVFSVFFIVWSLISGFLTILPSGASTPVWANVFVMVFGLVFMSPLFYGLFKYAYGKPKEKVME